MKPLSILVLHRKPYPCSHAMLETVYTRLLPQRGHRVTWVMPSGSDSTIAGWKTADWNGTPVYLLRYDFESHFLQKLVGRFRDQIRCVNHLLETGSYNILQARTDPIGGLVCAYMQRRWGIPFVYQVSFPMPDWWLSKSGWRKGIGWAWKRVERFLVDQAALVMPISSWMQARFEAEGVPAEKMISIPLGVETDGLPDEEEGLQIRQRLGWTDLPVVIYFGEMGRSRQLDFLLRAFQQVAQTMPDARLMMVGSSARGEHEVEWLKEVAGSLGILEKVYFTGRVSRFEVARYVLAADVSVSPIPPLPVYRISSPIKLVETLNLGRPLVANREILDHQHVLSESSGGICIPYEEAAFAEAIVWLLQHPDAAKQMGQCGQRYIRQHRSYEALASRVEQAYQNLIARQPQK
jgi:glycosyltransferase involved in cell wall biosynthesis